MNPILIYFACLTLALLYKVIKAEIRCRSAKKRYEGLANE